MKISIFYSWQSDLPNNKNRTFINSCLNKAIKQLLKSCPRVTEITLEMDSRNECGTPDLIESIFNKIDECDIFIADISIINLKPQKRLTPNPNVLLELGYAAKSKGWSNIICIFNTEFARIEDLPFDIRSRKPLIYNTSGELSKIRENLLKSLISSIEGIVNIRLTDKEEYSSTKLIIDLMMQSILFDFCRILYDVENNRTDRYNYPKVLNSSINDISQRLRNKKILGFYLFKNVRMNISEFIEFFNNRLETYFLLEKEKRLLAKMVFSLRKYDDLLHCGNLPQNKDLYKEEDIIENYILTEGEKISSEKSLNSYILFKKIDNKKGVVLDGGKFPPEIVDKLLRKLIINEDYIGSFSQRIYNIITLINDWIALTGNYFIANPKIFDNINS